ncbi:MAG: NAD(P)H dehydrogenase [Hyphomicrobiales bacterium]|nr:MAG: NAD(P)H dehydrogenase [Hyphomicrobiales bacterium]
MKILVVYAHPVETSFNAEVHRAVVEELKNAGHEVDDCDLYAENFDAILSREERINYHDIEINQRPVAGYVERVMNAEAIVYVHPIWNFGYPAILKGFLDRVFLPGVSFHINDGKLTPGLWHIKKMACVVTYGATRFRAMILGDPPRKVSTRMLRAAIKPAAPVWYMAQYDMNNASPKQLEAHLNKVRQKMARF